MKTLTKLVIVCSTCLLASSSATNAQVKHKMNQQAEVIHTVLFKFTGQTKRSQIDHLMLHIKALKTELPGIKAIALGQNFSMRSKGYTHAVTITFESRATLENFIAHHLHQELIKNYIKPILTDMIVVDYINEADQ